MLQIVNVNEPSPDAEEDRWGITCNETAAAYLVQMAKIA
jgi:hypothetical protein